MSILKYLITEMINDMILEEKIHKNLERTKDNDGNTDEISFEKGATIVSGNHIENRYKEYKIYGHEQKHRSVLLNANPDVTIFHHMHDFKKGDNGFISPDMNERMKKEGRFRVIHKLHSMSDNRVVKLFKTGTTAKKYAIEQAKRLHQEKVSNAKAASDWGYTGKYSSVSRNRQE